MSEPVTNVEIEDVLSSIRRLVSENARVQDARAQGVKPAEPPSKSDADRLVLTPALRVEEEELAEATPVSEEPPLEEKSVRAVDVVAEDDIEATTEEGPRVLNLSSNLPRFQSDPLIPETDEGDAEPVKAEPGISRAFDDAEEDPEMVFEPVKPKRRRLKTRPRPNVSEDAAPEDSLTDWYAMRADAIEAEYRPIEPDIDEADAENVDNTAEPEREALDNVKDALVEAVVLPPEQASEAETPETVETEHALSEGDADLDEGSESVPQEVFQEAPEEAAEASEPEVAEDDPVTADEIDDAEQIASPSATPFFRNIQRAAELEDSFHMSGSSAYAPEEEAPSEEIIEGHADVTEDEEEPQSYEAVLDEEMLRDLVGEIVRQELQGPLGERITRNVRKLVRREINRALATRQFD